MSNAWLSLYGVAAPQRAHVEPRLATFEIGGTALGLSQARWEVPTQGTVYAAALNHREAVRALGDALGAPPYVSAPKAPVLYIKPRNTQVACGVAVSVPADVPAIAVAPALAIVFARPVRGVRAEQALERVLGFTIANDLHVPHESFYRPALRHQCRDGFCPIGPWVIDRDAVPGADRLGVRTYINGTLAHHWHTSELIRGVAQLIADVSAMMTLRAGDVLLAGIAPAPPLARAGDHVRVEIDGIGSLETPLVAEGGGGLQ